MKRSSWRRLFLAAISIVVLEFGCSPIPPPRIEQAAQKMSGPGRPPVAVEVTGSVGYITGLADGRLFTVYGQCRPEDKWDDVSIPQPVFGRFSTDRGASWSEAHLLFNTPGPGWMHMLLPLGARDGAIHLFGLMIHRIKPPVKWTEATADIWHAVSHDAGKNWETPRKIDYGHKYTGALNSAIQLQSGRILVPFSYLDANRSTGLFVCDAVYSDDGGKTWQGSKGEIPVASGGNALESGSVEPVVTQLADGRVWMIIRTQTSYLFESYSSDGGASWSSPQPTAFRASNAPAAVLRADQRFYLVWNNEIGEPFDGSVSYSRKSLVTAVKEGDAWLGYRQVNPSFAPEESKGAARYPFLVDVGDGRLLLGYGETGRVRSSRHSDGQCYTYWNGGTRLFYVDPQWLVETEASENFSQGTRNLQLAGTSGIEVSPGPENKAALHLTKPQNDRPSGATWNFPLGKKGKLQMRLWLEPTFQGGSFTLSEYYLNPDNQQGGAFRWMIDPELKLRIQYVHEGPYQKIEGDTLQSEKAGPVLRAGQFHELSLEWDCELNVANLQIDGQYVGTLLGLEKAQGLAYLRLSSAASATDKKGYWVTNLRTQVQP